MKYFIYFVLPILLITGIPSKIKAEEQVKTDLIETYEEDITGDGLKETIELKGILLSRDATFYREIWVDVISKNDEQWKIQYEGGYEPSIQFIDLNRDGINNLFYQSGKNDTGETGKRFTYHLHTLDNGKVIEKDLPKQHYINGTFKDDFIVNLTISPHRKPHVVHVKDRSEEYAQQGVYNKEGKLLKPTPVIFDPIAFYEPVLISKSNGYGLKSYQQINGIDHTDQLGTIETLWYYENGGWIILQTEWKASR